MTALLHWNPLVEGLPPFGPGLVEVTTDIFAVPAGGCPAPFTNHESWHNSLISMMGGREDATFLLATRDTQAMVDRLHEWERQAQMRFPSNIRPTLKASTQAEFDKGILPLVCHVDGQHVVLLLEPTEGIIAQGNGEYIHPEIQRSRFYLRTNGGLGHVAQMFVRGQTGPNAQPLHPQWVRDLRVQAQNSLIPFSFLGWGQWLPLSQAKPGDGRDVPERSVWPRVEGNAEDLPLLCYRVGAARSGALLDDVAYDDRRGME